MDLILRIQRVLKELIKIYMKDKIKNELIEKVKKLNEDEQYLKVAEILSDDVLDNYKDYELYAEIAQANFKIEREYGLYAKKSLEIRENAKAYNYYGNSISKQDEKKSRIYYEKALELDSSFITSSYNLGNSYSRSKEYDLAIKYYKLSLSINPRYLKAIHGIGNVYLRKRMYNEAKLHFDTALNIKPENSEAYNSYGILHLWKKELEKAEEYFLKSIKFDQSNCQAYNNLAGVLFKNKNYSESKKNYQKSILNRNTKDSFYELAISRIEEINKILANEDYKKIQEIVSKIKQILEHKDKCITHFTSLSVAKLLIFENSKFRLSEGAYLNDTSEGRELFSFLNHQSPFGKRETPVDEIFVQKPFIGSFVSESKHNDLTMWRMYGKEGKDEARGCALTMNVKYLIDKIQNELGVQNEENEFEIKFYKVAYWKEDKFIIPDEKITSTKVKNLNNYCLELKKALDEFNLKDEDVKIQIDMEELLFEIAFLFKGIEYQYEHEVRLVQKGIGFEKKIDKNFLIPRVYIELGEICSTIEKITLGPKVDNADEWASAFHYQLKNKEIEAEIHISRQPFK
jgi:tetratricopeptide (TPR) repeat protein